METLNNKIMKNIFRNLTTPNSKKATKILLSIKVTCASLAATSLAESKPELAFYLLFAAGAADIIVSAFDNGDKKTKDDDASSDT